MVRTFLSDSPVRTGVRTISSSLLFTIILRPDKAGAHLDDLRQRVWRVVSEGSRISGLPC